jgi:hypothetical protein
VVNPSETYFAVGTAPGLTRFCVVAGCGRQQQYRGSREPQATDKAAPGIWILQHL